MSLHPHSVGRAQAKEPRGRDGQLWVSTQGVLREQRKSRSWLPPELTRGEILSWAVGQQDACTVERPRSEDEVISSVARHRILCGRVWVSRPMEILRQCLSTYRLSWPNWMERVLLVYDNIQCQTFSQMMSLGVQVHAAKAPPSPWLRYNRRKSLACSAPQELYGCSLSTGELGRHADPRVHPRPAELVHIDLNNPSW